MDFSALYLSAGALAAFLLILSIAGAYMYKRRQVILDFSWLRDYLQNHGAVVVQDIRCPYCGGYVAIPEKGLQIALTVAERFMSSRFSNS